MRRRPADVPLAKDISDRFLPWLVAFMVYFVALAVISATTMHKLVERWDKGLSGQLTVEVPPPDPGVSETERRGRIDRVEQASGATAIVDYKTGKPPRTDDVISGESVQLPSYALLLDASVVQLDYLEFTKDQAKQQTCAKGEELQQLLHDVGQRLTQLDAALHESAALREVAQVAQEARVVVPLHPRFDPEGRSQPASRRGIGCPAHASRNRPLRRPP